MKTDMQRDAIEHYYASLQGSHSLWIGLKKKDLSVGPCIDSGCDDLLQWTDGSNFLFDSSAHGAVYAGNANAANCFKYTTDKLESADCMDTGYFVCQSLSTSYPCVASTYQYSDKVGKYFKVNILTA